MVLDEISMIGMQFLGKIVFKVQDTLGVRVEEYGGGQPSLHGKDCVLNGHMLQAKPIGDVEAYREPSPEERRKAEKAEARRSRRNSSKRETQLSVKSLRAGPKQVLRRCLIIMAILMDARDVGSSKLV